MIHEEEHPPTPDGEGGFDDVYGEAPPVDDHQLSTQPDASGGQ